MSENITNKDVQLYKAYKEAVSAATKNVTVEISPEDLRILKDSGYNLCFAKKVGDAEYNVIWQSLNVKQYLMMNKFSWTPKYQIFATNVFENGIKVIEETGSIDIGLGQTTTLDSYGIFTVPIDGGSPAEITSKNDFGTIHFGLNQMCCVQGRSIFCPIYVESKVAVKGVVTMVPREKLQVWFEANAESGTIFTMRRSMAIELDLSGMNDVKVLYQNGAWKIIG